MLACAGRCGQSATPALPFGSRAFRSGGALQADCEDIVLNPLLAVKEARSEVVTHFKGTINPKDTAAAQLKVDKTLLFGSRNSETETDDEDDIEYAKEASNHNTHTDYGRYEVHPKKLK